LLEGEYYPFSYSQLVPSLPTNTHLVLDSERIDLIPRASVTFSSKKIEMIYCGRAAVDLSWLSPKDRGWNSFSPSMKIYLPDGLTIWERGYPRREELARCSFEIEAEIDDL
jgi:hypothetical protein